MIFECVHQSVIPAKAGISYEIHINSILKARFLKFQIPAFAGMTAIDLMNRTAIAQAGDFFLQAQFLALQLNDGKVVCTRVHQGFVDLGFKDFVPFFQFSQMRLQCHFCTSA
jgi:hypothetical protein